LWTEPHRTEVQAWGLTQHRVLGDVAGAAYDPCAWEFADIAGKPTA
jgi:hypothetical protein